MNFCSLKAAKPILCVFATALAFVASAQITKTGDTYLFRVKYVKGTKTVYTIVSTTPLLSKPIPMTMSVGVKDVKGPNATIELSMGAVAGQPARSATIVVDNRNQSDGAAGFGVALPVGPIKVGAKWKASLPMQGTSGGPAETSPTYTFRGIRTVSGKQVALIDITLSGGTQGTGSLTLLVSDGTLFSNNMKLGINAGGKSATVETTITRK